MNFEAEESTQEKGQEIDRQVPRCQTQEIFNSIVGIHIICFLPLYI